MEKNKKIIATLLTIMIICSSFYIPAYAEVDSLSERVVIQNNYIQAITNLYNARFSIRTLEGSPYRIGDQETNLLFNGKEPETSFTTFKINGKDYIYGNDYEYAGLGDNFALIPTRDEMLCKSKWKIGDIEISQVLEVEENIENPQVGNVKISYIVKNNGTDTAKVGSRMLLDTMIGNNDGASILLPESDTPIRCETKLENDEVPAYWRAVDSASNPQVVGYGLIDLMMKTKPNKMVIGHWNGLSKTKWDYEVDTTKQFASTYNDFGTADSAIALYWDPVEISAGESQTFETYYGLGDFLQEQEENFLLNVYAPDKLTVDNGQYVEKQFIVAAEIDNTLTDSSPLVQINVALDLPEGLKLVEGESQEKTINYVPNGGVERVEWNVIPKVASNLKVLQLKVRAYSEIVEEKSDDKFIILPGICGQLPEIYYKGYMPKMLYGPDNNKSIHLIGKGFGILADFDKWEFSLENKMSGEKCFALKDYITIVSDEQLAIGIPDILDPGQYIMKISHDVYGEYTFDTPIDMSNDSSLVSRDYELLVINNSGDGYTAEMKDNETNSSAVLTIRGQVREIEKGNKYEVIPNDTATINSVVKYKGNPLQVYKEGDVFKIKGDGILTLNTKSAGQNLDLKLQNGKFVLDSSNLTFKPQDGYINDESVENVGGLPLIIKEIKLDENNGVDIDGDLQLPIDKLSKFFLNDYFDKLGGYLEDIIINSSGIEYVGEIEIPFPYWRVGSFQSKYNKVTLCINTKNNNYGLKTVMYNRPLKLDDINTTLMFEKWVPQYFEFENDFKNKPKPIGTTGLGYQKIGGGIYDISSLWEDKRPTTTIKATCDIVDMISPFTIQGYRLFTGKDLTATIGFNGIDMKGDAYIYFMDVGDIKGEFKYDRGGYIEADLNILDILVMEAYMCVMTDNFEASLSGDVYFPKKVPFVGGEKLVGFTAGMSLEKIYGSTEFLGCDVGVTYYWKSQDFDFDAHLFGMVDSYNCAMGNKAGLYTMNTTTKDGRETTMVLGSNIEKIENKTTRLAYDGDIRKLGTIAEIHKVHNIDIYGFETALLKIDYDGVVPSVQVTKPDKSLYELRPREEGVTNPNYLNKVISAEDSTSGEEEKSIYISIQNPDEGTWIVNSDIAAQVTLYNVKESPKFTNLSVEQDEEDPNDIDVKWDVTTEEDSYVSFYLTKNNEINMDMSLTEEGDEIEASDGETDFYLGDLNGEYQILAKVTREDFGYDIAFSNTFVLDDDLPMKTPSAFKVESIGNGYMKASWDYDLYAGDYSLKGWLLQAVDENGEVDQTVEGEFFIENYENTEIVFGGVSMDEEGEPCGWLPNREYTFSLTTLGKPDYYDDDTVYYSKPAISDTIFLPKPEPPIIAAELSSLDGTVKDGGINEEIETKYVNGNLLNVEIETNKEAQIEVYNDMSIVKNFTGTQGTVLLNLKSGINEVSIVATAENGDMSVKEYSIISDTSAPYLMVESPSRGEVVDSDTIDITGKTEIDALLTINGQEVLVESDGSFSETINLTDELNKTVSIKSQDAAGNITSYKAEIWNSNIEEITGVTIKPSDTDVENGTDQRFELYANTSDGKETLIGSSMVNWEIVDNIDIATISEDGILSARAVGEVIIKASYHISEDYAFEDAMFVNISPATSTPSQMKKIISISIRPENCEIEESSYQKFGLYGKTYDGEEKLINNEDVTWEIVNNSDIATISQSGTLFANSVGKVTLKAYYTNSDGFELDTEIKVNIVKEKKHDKKTTKRVRINGNRDTVIKLSDNIIITIPTGALAEGNYVTVREINKPSSNSLYLKDISDMKLSSPLLSIYIEGSDTTLKKKAEIQIKYDSNKVNNTDQLGIYRYNNDNRWELVGGMVDKNNNTIKVKVDHFSNYTVFENDNLTIMQDMKNHWAKDIVNRLILRKIVNGIKVSNNEFKYNPEGYITRAEFSKLLAKAKGFEIEDNNIEQNGNFIDSNQVPQWAKPYMQYCYSNGWINGVANSEGLYLMPNKPITRAEVATILGRTLAENHFNNNSFIDKKLIPKWASKYVDMLVSIKIINGYPDNSFKPDNKMTRAEVAALINNYLKIRE